MRRDRRRAHWLVYAVALAVFVLLLGHVLGIAPLRGVRQLDALIYDGKVRLFAPRTPDPRIVIVDVDDRSLAEIGRWPWRRDLFAAVLDKLFDDYGVRAVGFDIVFAGADQSGGAATLDALANGPLAQNPAVQAELARLRNQHDPDARFARAIAGRPVVLGYFFSQEAAGSESGALPEPLLPAGEQTAHLAVQSSYGANLPVLQAQAAAAGQFNVNVDPDGVSRRVPLLAAYGGKVYESLSLAMLRVVNQGAAVTLESPRASWLSAGNRRLLERVSVSGPQTALRIPVDDNGNALVPYRGPPGTITYVSVADVLKGSAPMESLRGKIVLVGTSAGGLLDLRVTPLSNTFVGVEIHANLLSGMLDGEVKRVPSWSPAFEALMLVVVGAIVLATLPGLNPLRAVFNAAGMALLLVVANFVAWEMGLALPLAASLLQVFALLALQVYWGYSAEARTRRQFTHLFGQYVPPELVREMSRNPENYSMEGQNREVTVLFCDIRGFTSIAETLEPRLVAQLLGEFLTAMTAVIGRHRGTVDKYIGDAIMAFWGAPLDDATHAADAVATALEMQREMQRLSESLVARGFPPLEMGVGINTGMVTVGDFGSVVRKAYTVIGDAVNLASRLEGLTRRYGVGIIVGEGTRAAVRDGAWRELDRVRVKGKGAAVTIYEPLGPQSLLTPAAEASLAAWHEALARVRARDWDGAAEILRTLAQSDTNSALYALYLERIGQLKADPPPADWDGVAAFDYK